MTEDIEDPVSSGNNNGSEVWVQEFTTESAQQFREQVLERSDKEGVMVIPIYIDSYGGSVDALAKMISTMDSVPNRFVTVCIGKACSAGAVLLSHGDIRFCDKYSRVMVHNLSTVLFGDVHALAAGSSEANRLNLVFNGLLAKNCGISYHDLQQKIKDAPDSKDLWMSPDDAHKFGIVDQIGVPELVPVIQWACDARPDKERFNLRDHLEPATSKKKTTTAKKKRK